MPEKSFSQRAHSLVIQNQMVIPTNLHKSNIIQTFGWILFKCLLTPSDPWYNVPVVFLYCTFFFLVLDPSFHSKVRILLPQTLDWWDYSRTFPCDIFGVFCMNFTCCLQSYNKVTHIYYCMFCLSHYFQQCLFYKAGCIDTCETVPDISHSSNHSLEILSFMGAAFELVIHRGQMTRKVNNGQVYFAVNKRQG